LRKAISEEFQTRGLGVVRRPKISVAAEIIKNPKTLAQNQGLKESAAQVFR